MILKNISILYGNELKLLESVTIQILDNKFKKINLSTEEFESKFWKSKSAESFYNNLPSSHEDPMTSIFKNSMHLWSISIISPIGYC